MRLGREQRLVVGGIPRADLLPEEVRAGRRAYATRRALALGVVVALFIAILGVATAKITVTASAAALQAARNQTNSLIRQQAAYSGVTSARARLTSVDAARATATGTEILWKPYLERVGATLPNGMSIVTVQIDSAAPGQPYLQPTSPLQGPRVATLTLHVTTRGLASIQTWLNALPVLPGFVDASAGNVAADAGGQLGADVVVHINAKAYTAASPESASSVRAKSSQGVKPTPTPTPVPVPVVTSTPTPTPVPTVTVTVRPPDDSASTAARASSTKSGTTDAEGDGR
ncbi:hypothetical protein [uncultured Amnibacterium sp.]|uniref:hypothetical protein n=1 Tax=uncultured Amnibacterium sp. TaxID=1631851 RepID=UPI0035CC2810